MRFPYRCLTTIVIIINSMSTQPSDSPLQKYLIVGGAISAAYLLIKYLTSKSSSPKGCDRNTTRKIMKEVKYQIYTFCIPFAEAISTKLKIGAPPKDIEIYFRTELAKGFEVKEGLIINKYDVAKEDYAAALEKFKNDKEIRDDQEEVLKVLEDTVKGQVELQIPAELKRLLTLKEVVALYRQLCEKISVQVSKLLREALRKDPSFNPKDDQQYKRAMKDMNIYDFKVDYLKARGFKEEWGCPNFNFLKLLESLKRENLEVKLEATNIDRGYTKVIDLVQKDPQNYGEVEILRLMEDEIVKGREQLKPKPAPRQEQQAPAPRLAQSLPNPPARVAPQKPKPQPKEEEVDLEELMMRELLSRSQEEPKELKVEVQAPVVVPAPVEPKIEAVTEVIEVKVEPIVEVKVESVPEPEIEVKVEPVPQEVAEVKVEQVPEPAEVERIQPSQERPIQPQIKLEILQEKPEAPSANDSPVPQPQPEAITE